jgi:glycosyltransferase involved in cell wall biosynthesis
MNEEPLVSVIIPNYNYASTIGECIKAAQTQSYPRIEIIVADDASTDDSVAIAAGLGVSVVQVPVNSGVSTARNLGVSHANGEVLFFVDSDVALDPDAVEKAVRYLQEDPKLGGICGMYRAEPMFPDSLVKRYRAIQQYVWFVEIEGAIPGLHSALFAMWTKTFREVGEFNDQLRWTEEQDYGFRLNAKYEVKAVPDIRGRHDHDGTLKIMLTKVFNRTRLGAPNWLRLRKMPGGAGTSSRALGSAFVLAGLLAPFTAVFLGWSALGLAAVLLGIGIICDWRTYSYAFKHEGILFGLQFVPIHLLVMLTSGVAAGIGILQGVLYPSMTRKLYRVQTPA